MKKLQLIFNRSTRFIIEISPIENNIEALIDLNWLPVKDRILFMTYVLTYIALSIGKPICLRETLEKCSIQLGISVRRSYDQYRLNETNINKDIGTRS